MADPGAPEDPGPYCFPPVAAAITAAARLMLALLERLVRDAGGHYAFCDTDSMAIVATRRGSTVPCPTADGEHRIRALSFQPGRRDPRTASNTSTPTTRRSCPHPGRVEADSMNRALHCYVISAKRYCLYRDHEGQPEIVAAVDATKKRPETPSATPSTTSSRTGPNTDSASTSTQPPRTPTDPTRRQGPPALGRPGLAMDPRRRPRRPTPHSPPGPTATRSPASPSPAPTSRTGSRATTTATRATNAIRPGSFGLIAHPTALSPRGRTSRPPPTKPTPTHWPRPRLVRPPHRQPDPRHDIRPRREPRTPLTQHDARRRPDPTTPRHPQRLPAPPRTEIARPLRPHPPTPNSHGLLQRRPITSSPAETDLTGKEGNKLIERASGEITDPADYRNSYGTRGDTWQLVLEILREIGVPTIVEQTGFSRSAVYAVLNGANPRTDHASAYTKLAVQHGRERLTAWEVEPARRPPQLLVQYRQERDRRGESIRRCEWCGQPIPPDRRTDTRFHSDQCRWVAARAASQAGG